MNEEWRAEALKLIEFQIKHIVESQGGTVDIEISKGYPYLENDPEVTSRLKMKAQEYLGEALWRICQFV